MNLDRFEFGIQDNQNVEVFSNCAICGGEVYKEDNYWILDDDYVCSFDTCVILWVQKQCWSKFVNDW